MMYFTVVPGWAQVPTNGWADVRATTLLIAGLLGSWGKRPNTASSREGRGTLPARTSPASTRGSLASFHEVSPGKHRAQLRQQAVRRLHAHKVSHPRQRPPLDVTVRLLVTLPGHLL